jgi:hypothetical protein
MNLISGNSFRQEKYFSREKNPYRHSIRADRIEQNMLSWFYRLSVPFFSRDILEEQDVPTGFRIYSKDAPQTIEWNLEQSTASLLVNDLKVVAKSLTPSPVLRLFRDIRNYIVIFMSTDEIDIEEALLSLPEEEQGRVIIMQQRTIRMQISATKFISRSARNVIHFSDAMRIIMLRSIHKMKKLPALFAANPVKNYVAERLDRLVFISYRSFLLLVKKMYFTVINKRN